jgi:hypothetical protein
VSRAAQIPATRQRAKDMAQPVSADRMKCAIGVLEASIPESAAGQLPAAQVRAGENDKPGLAPMRANKDCAIMKCEVNSARKGRFPLPGGDGQIVKVDGNRSA